MKRYSGDDLREIVVPLGGIGTGSIGFSGSGRLVEWEIRNRPAKRTFNGFSHLAIRAESGGSVLDARLLAGPWTGAAGGSDIHAGDQGLFGFGAPRESLAGMPGFATAEFSCEFPIATLRLSDPEFPGKVEILAFNPLIPLNEFDSGLPAAMFRIRVENPTDRPIDYTVVLAADNPWDDDGRNARVDLGDVRGVRLSGPDGELAIASRMARMSYQEYWFNGSWFDSLAVYFRELRTPGPFVNRPAPDGARIEAGSLPRGARHALIAPQFTVEPDGDGICELAIAWFVPERSNDWTEQPLDPEIPNRWRNWYATVFDSAFAAAGYALREFDRLLRETERFVRAFYDSTLPEVFLEAAGASLAVLKSPTVMRLEDGSLYGFEGCAPEFGCCEGSCSHVWNYAWAVPCLFPSLARSMRSLEFRYNLRPDGGLAMRLMLPLGNPSHYIPCADGQFGTVLKVYREWRVSGDDAWLLARWPGVRRAVEFAWSPDNPFRWDPAQTGLLTGRQHHTLDMDLFGPNSWLSSMYLAALDAAARMADRAGDGDFAARCREIRARGVEKLNDELFNGEYFYQKIDLGDRSVLAPYSQGNGWCHDRVRVSVEESYWDEEHGELKYQIGEGCGIDQLLGAWFAGMLGLNPVFDPEKARTALRSILRYNFHESHRGVFNPCRLFSFGDDAGTAVCAWPENRRKGWNPLLYAEETMSGFEYALAGELLLFGLPAEAERVARAVRRRYDGARRNPWNEMECGSNYVRSMAAWSLPLIASGFRCDLTRREMSFDPKVPVTPGFRTFWCAGTAWGVLARTPDAWRLEVLAGSLEIEKLTVPGAASAPLKSGTRLMPGDVVTVPLLYPATQKNKEMKS